MANDLVFRLRKRAEIRRQIPGRKSVEEGKPDRMADLLDEAAAELELINTCVADANAVHLNMLRGGIAKLAPEHLGHLYRGQEAIDAVFEIMRQNPDINWRNEIC